MNEKSKKTLTPEYNPTEDLIATIGIFPVFIISIYLFVKVIEYLS